MSISEIKPNIIKNSGISNHDIEIRPYHLLKSVCTLGGLECPLHGKEIVKELVSRIKQDPTLRIKLVSNVDEIPYYKNDYRQIDKQDVFNRKRDLDILQKLGLIPGDIRRARYLFELLFQRITTPYGICSFDTEGWQGCQFATSGVYEIIRNRSFSAMVYLRGDEERNSYKKSSVNEIAKSDTIYIRPHHLMCMCCHYDAGKGNSPSNADNLYEILKRIQEKPDINITLVEGCCMVCDPCDGYDPKTGLCVHAGGLIRDYKKDLDVLQKLGLMPGATMQAKELISLMFERIGSTKDICGYGDGIITAYEWSICGGADGNEAYSRTREKGIF
jgi:hypothetical protein